jgi:hypothetical protein
MEEQKTYTQSWAMLRNLWPDWEPNQTTINLCFERWSKIHQDHLQEAIKQHKWEAGGQYKEPKIHRIMDIYAMRTSKEWAVSEPGQNTWKCEGPTKEELEEWDRWADDVLADVTEEEVKEANALYPMKTKRFLAVAVDFIRKRKANPNHANEVVGR